MVIAQGHVYWANLPDPTGSARTQLHFPLPVVTLDRELLTEEVGKLSKRQVELILAGIDIILGR